jgi:DNA-binding NarL/FixJ family response regulator
MTPKQTKANRIAQIVMCICDHYRISPKEIANWEGDENWHPQKSVKVTSAKQLLIYHLHECGMSYEAIAKSMYLKINTVTEHRAKGNRIVLNGMRDFVDELPRVTTTLQVSQATP